MKRKITALAALLMVVLCINAKGIESTDKTYANGLFAPGELCKVDIEIEDSAWQHILERPQEKSYHACAVTINGDRLDNVAIRTKGASSLDDVRIMKLDRYSFTLDLDKYRKGQEYHGLRKILLNNNIWDATQMKDAIVYDMSRFMGLPAPLTNYARVTVNGRLHGYYLLVEPVDKQFCRRNYPGERSSIYKPYYNLAYKSDSIASYTEIAGERKVGGGETSLRYVMEACKSVDKGTDIEKHVDVESIMKYLALQTMAVNFDCMTGHNMQNWYLHEGCGRISIIPWDYNLAWGGYPDEDEWEDWPVDEHSNERDEEGLNSWMNFSRPSEDLGESTSEEVSLIVNFPIDTPFTDDLKKRTFFMNLLSNDMYKAMYYHYLEVLCRRYVRGGRLSHTIKTIKREIGKTAGTEPNAFYTNKQFQEGVRTLDKLLQLKAQSVMGQMKGTVPSTWDTQKAHPEKLIDCKGLNLRKLGGLGY